jgi:threonine synthase
VPTGNFGDILAGYFAKRMGLPVAKLVIATNENDILTRFWNSGTYEKHPSHSPSASNGLAVDGAKAHEDGVRETLSPAMDILVSSNFERLLWYLAYEYAAGAGMDDTWTKQQAGQEVANWHVQLKSKGGFSVNPEILALAQRDFESERVTDAQTTETIAAFYDSAKYVLDPHSAVGVAAAERSIARAEGVPHISLSTAHPAKFAGAVEVALAEREFDFASVLPEEFVGLQERERRVTDVPAGAGWEGVREIVVRQVEEELRGERA